MADDENPQDDEEPPSWDPQPWWDELDVKVREGLLAVQESEGIRSGQPDLYDRSERVLERFNDQYPQLAAALLTRYGVAPEADDEEDAARYGGIGTWMLENAVGEQFPGHDATS